MNKIQLFVLLIFSGTFFYAQTWCPPGATWHIKRGGFVSDFGTTNGVIKVSYTGDTTILGFSCKQLSAVFKGRRLLGSGGGDNITEPYNTYYTYSNNNVIFLYNGSNAFDTVVNFNAIPGDKWLKPRSTQTYCLLRPILTVTDTGHVTINGFFLKQIKTIDSAKVQDWSGQNTYTYTYEEKEVFLERIFFSTYLKQNIFFLQIVKRFPGHLMAHHSTCYVVMRTILSLFT